MHDTANRPDSNSSVMLGSFVALRQHHKKLGSSKRLQLALRVLLTFFTSSVEPAKRLFGLCTPIADLVTVRLQVTRKTSIDTASTIPE